MAAASSRRRRAASLRHISMRRRDATATSQPFGLPGRPSDGPLLRRGDERLLDGILAASKSR